MKLNDEIEKIMTERFGKDSVIALATAQNNVPYVRNVDGYYENGVFYVITYALSDKMRQINANPEVAVSGDWFTARGKAVDLGYFCKPGNKEIAEKLKAAFAAWIDNGYNNFDDENTIILSIKLTEGRLFANGAAYDIDFRK